MMMLPSLAYCSGSIRDSAKARWRHDDAAQQEQTLPTQQKWQNAHNGAVWSYSPLASELLWTCASIQA